MEQLPLSYRSFPRRGTPYNGPYMEAPPERGTFFVILRFNSGKLPTYPSPKPTLTLTSHLRQNVRFGEGKG